MEKAEELVLAAAEALPRDMGRTIARMDPAVLSGQDLVTGDVIKIKGKRETVARVMPSPPEQRDEPELILIDGMVRENAMVLLGEKVTVSKTQCQPGKMVILEPVGKQGIKGGEYLARLLEGLVMVKGDKLRVNLFGSRTQEVRVCETLPAGVVQIGQDTEIKLKALSGQPEEQRVAYEDIGGLENELMRVREIIELPLKYPEVFDRLGIEAPQGVLLSGPPGTGKTLIARAVARESKASFFHINGPEIIHKYYGESEARLREIFEAAQRRAPSIIFLDEIDAVAPKREEVHGEVEKRVVAQLLGLMDGLKSRGQVIVIGATNIPNALDPALRRPGRFDREISIGVPDERGRLKILQIHTRGMPLAEDVDLEKLARRTHGYVGADLEALCKEAAMGCLRQVFPALGGGPVSLESLYQLKVGMEHFLNALREIEPTVTREVCVELPDVSFEQVGGLGEIKEKLAEAVEWPLKYPELFAEAGMDAAKGTLFYGPPGTGKTLMAKALAKQCEANFISVKGPALMSKWVGESEKGVREVFRKARLASPCIIFFDELDALVPQRGRGGGDPAAERVLSQLLTEMDGIEELRGVMVMGATNRIDMIDPALLRPGRFDLHLEFPYPDREARLEILKIHFAGKPVAPEVDLKLLQEQTEGFSGAEIANLCRRAALLAVRDIIKQGNFEPGGLEITRQHFQLALKELGRERR